MESLKSKIENRVQECVQIVRSKFPLHVFPTPSVHFDIRGVTGGTAEFGSWSVHFNLDLAIKNESEYLNQVVPHEIAHLADYRRYNNWGHGRTWKNIMKYVFQLEPKRCHQMDTSEVKRNNLKTFIYICKCKDFEHVIKANRHKKISIMGKNYRCINCKNRITYKSFVENF
jgi:SprT protein